MYSSSKRQMMMAPALRIAVPAGAAMLGLALLFAGEAKAASPDTSPRVVSSRHIVNADYNCEVMELKKRSGATNFYAVGMKCTGIVPGVKVRGTLDIELAPDSHTEWVTHQTLVSGKTYESEYGNRSGRSVRLEADRA